MKKLIAALTLVAVSAVGLSAGEVNSNSLAKMGFGGVQTMSDAEGMAVRGMGTSVVIIGANAVNVGGAAAIGSNNQASNVQLAVAVSIIKLSSSGCCGNGNNGHNGHGGKK